MEYPILLWPSPTLTAMAAPFIWETAEENYLDKLTTVMLAAMIRARGIGIAAPQIGESTRIIIAIDKDSVSKKPITLINPDIIENHTEIDSKRERCLSLPGEEFDVVRFKRIRVRYQDEDKRFQEIYAEGFFAIELQHEIDYLNGKLLVDQVSQTRRTIIRDRLNITKKKQKRNGDTWRDLDDLAGRLLISSALEAS